MKHKELITEICVNAKKASAALVGLTTDVKNRALTATADLLIKETESIIRENSKDIEIGTQKNLSKAMLDRLFLNDKRIKTMSDALRQITILEDPVGEIFDVKVRPNGLTVGRMRTPIGVIGIIYEARPNVTTDAASLCLKSGNAVILRGGSESINSNIKLAEIFQNGCRQAGVHQHAVQLIPIPDREMVGELLKMNEYVDLVIPRGGKTLIERVVHESLIPVIKHYDGNCFVYVDESADFDMAKNIIINAKTQRPGVCNAMETLLVHKAIASQFIKDCGEELIKKNVEIRGCSETCKILAEAKQASEEDFRTEYLDLILAVKVIDSIDDAIAFINKYGSHHTDAIVTSCYFNSMKFQREVDSACVHVNCSTRFSDGGEFGMGAEIGISTDKLHARGPMGLKELTSAKFIVLGNGQIRT